MTAHQIKLTYLPIVDLASGHTHAAEALARWQHPELGELPPNRFLTAVERAGRLAEFTAAVLDQALADAAEWARTNLDLTVAVNISPRSLLDAGFADDVLRLLDRHQVAAHRLTLEITEQIPISDAIQVNDNLEKLTDADVKIALDDFGSGSSFRLLHWLPIPISALKIGRDDVARMHTTTGNAVLHAVTDLSRRLNVPVVAVGVETADQRRTLWEAGCTSGQGTALGGTMPHNNLVQALHDGALTSVLHQGADVIPLRSTAPGR